MTTVVSPFTQAGREVLIAEAARTPMGRSHPERGWFRDTHPNTMLAACYAELLARSGLAPSDVEDLVIGCTAPFGEQSRNIGRNAWLQAGYPPEVPAVTLDRRCGSAQTAVEVAAGLIASGTHDVIIAGGVEHMGHVPIDSPSKLMELYGDPWPAELRDQYAFVGQGESAELIADRWQIGRDEMDAYAARSHVPADKIGRFAANYTSTADGRLMLIDDPQKSIFGSKRKICSGGGGLVSTAGDYMRFCQMMLNKGELDGVRLLGRKTVELMTMNHLRGDMADMGQPRFSESSYAGIGFGLGFSVTLDPAKAQILGSPGEYAWGGAASTAFWIDPVEDMAVILLTQLMPSSTYPIRRELRVLTYQALVD